MKTLLATLALTVSVNATATEIYDLQGHLRSWDEVIILNVHSRPNGTVIDNYSNFYEFKGTYKLNGVVKSCHDGKFFINAKPVKKGYSLPPDSCVLQQVDNTPFDIERLNRDYSQTANNIRQRLKNVLKSPALIS